MQQPATSARANESSERSLRTDVPTDPATKSAHHPQLLTLEEIRAVAGGPTINNDPE